MPNETKFTQRNQAAGTAMNTQNIPEVTVSANKNKKTSTDSNDYRISTSAGGGKYLSVGKKEYDAHKGAKNVYKAPAVVEDTNQYYIGKEGSGTPVTKEEYMKAKGPKYNYTKASDKYIKN